MGGGPTAGAVRGGWRLEAVLGAVGAGSEGAGAGAGPVGLEASGVGGLRLQETALLSTLRGAAGGNGVLGLGKRFRPAGGHLGVHLNVPRMSPQN